MVVGNDVGAQVLARQTELKPEQKFQLMTSPDHIALNKNEPRFKQALNEIIAKMLADGTLNKISRNGSASRWIRRTSEADGLQPRLQLAERGRSN